MNNTSLTIPTIPNWIIWVQCIFFSVLYAIWALPETILIRHICLILGALIGLYEIYQYRHLFLHKGAAPAWLLLSLFFWATFHLIFLSNDFSAQYAEYTSIWKRTILGAIFALGLGLSLANIRYDTRENRALWALIYFGLLMPTIIYIVKFLLTHYGTHYGWSVPNFLKLYSSSSLFYLPKTAYVCFCLPALGISLGQLVINFRNYRNFKWVNLIYVISIMSVLFVFYGENIKNGVVFSVVLMVIFICVFILGGSLQHLSNKLAIVGLVMVVGMYIVANNIQTNTSWQTLRADAIIALDTANYDHWKYNGEKNYPVSSLGKMVSGTNYDRIAWGKVGLTLIAKNPLGFGLIERSFGRLAKANWPDSKLHQSHSGWIDLTLGIGIPGISIILICFFISLFQLFEQSRSTKTIQNTYHAMVICGLFSCLIMWCTSELSQKVFFDCLIFWLALSVGFNLVRSKSQQHASNSKIFRQDLNLIT